MIVANEARGEVAVTIDGEDYILAPTFARMARYQKALEIKGLHVLLGLVAMSDADALYQGIRCLAASGNLEKFEHARFADVEKVQAALIKALAGDQESGNAGGAAGSQSPDTSPRAAGSN